MRLRSTALLCTACALCLASTCPTPDPFPAEPIRAPSLTALELTGIKSGGIYQRAVHLQWKLLGKDSIPIAQFVILRKQMLDSSYSIMHYGIPDTQYDDWDVLDAGDFPDPGVYAKIWYRVFALDLSGRSGDTSAADSIRLTWPPRITYPEDTLKNNLFQWSTVLYLGGYYSYLYLWEDARGLLWTSPRPEEPTYGHETPDSHTVTLLSPPGPLSPGKYFCGVKVEIPGARIQSMAIRQFYAP